jgi:hypothetical protein
MHLFADISSHGFGHLAQAAPVLNTLAGLLPGLRLTVRCGVPEAKFREHLRVSCTLIAGSSDFGYVMHDATRINLPASRAAYQAAHQDWDQRVAAEVALLRQLAPDLVFSDVAYLPLAGAAEAGIPAVAMCSLNWAELFAHFFSAPVEAVWAAPIFEQMAAAYRSATAFLRTTPAMPMPLLAGKTHDVGPIARLGQNRRAEIDAHLLQQGIDNAGTEKRVLVAMGGIAHRLPIENWPVLPGIRWLVPGAWGIPARRTDISDSETLVQTLGLDFADQLASVEAVVTKPGYGTFAEAACNGTPVLYQRREDWPEQDCLIDWLQGHARCREVSVTTLQTGALAEDLHQLWEQPPLPRPAATGALEAATFLQRLLLNQ